MKPKHTPGQWEIDKRAKTRVQVNDRTIADTGGYRTTSDNKAKAEEENKANAKLIAAAPEMLKIICEVDNLLRCQYSHNDIAEIKIKLESAIKKATE
jgi:hypothetical protein